MTIELKKLKTRYGGKCSRCEKDIKEGWDVYFSPETKAVYCLPCGEVLKNSNEQQNIEVPENLNITSRLDSLALKQDHFYTISQVILSDCKRIIERLESLEKRIATFEQKLPQPKTAELPELKPKQKKKTTKK